MRNSSLRLSYQGIDRSGVMIARKIAELQRDAKPHKRFSSTPITDRGILLRARLMESEKELLDAFDRLVHEDFPNPGRIACPGHEVLLKLARQPADTRLADLLAHARKCAPCFDELKELRQKGKIHSP
jgi:hypothetical protein